MIFIDISGCCCPDEGSGGSGSFETEVWDCLDIYAFSCANPCPGNVLAAHWCMTFNLTGPDDPCPTFNGFALQVDGDSHNCFWTWNSTNQAGCDGPPDPADWCPVTSAEVRMDFVVSGGGIPGGPPITAPSCGVTVYALSGPAKAWYFVDIASFNCTGSNTLDLLYEDTSGSDPGWPATLTITPCADDGCP